MKKLLLTTIMVGMLIPTLSAQTEESKKLVGGQLRIYGNFLDNGTRPSGFGYNISPYFGYFIKNNLTVGGGVSYSKQKTKYERASTEYIYQDFAIFAASRYYIPIGESKKFYAYLQGSLQFTWDKDEYVHLSQEIVIREYTLAIAPGFVYFPSPRWGLELGFSGLSFQLIDRKDRDNYTRLTLGADSFVPTLGVSYYF